MTAPPQRPLRRFTPADAFDEAAARANAAAARATLAGDAIAQRLPDYPGNLGLGQQLLQERAVADALAAHARWCWARARELQTQDEGDTVRTGPPVPWWRRLLAWRPR